MTRSVAIVIVVYEFFFRGEGVIPVGPKQDLEGQTPDM